MKSILLSLLVITSFHFNGSAQSQPFKCAHSNPSQEALHNMHALRSSGKSTDTKIIPVVFHVLHQNGFENISDAQILNQMVILNEDFQRLNADTAVVEAPFDTIIGKVNFEFRLATIDPNGNPTNGIDRMNTPLTNVGDESAMINMWDPISYVNIWVVNISHPGISGFSTNPLQGENPCAKGIVILHDYVGSIGTGSPATSFVLTHEMGHYFGLFHVWGEGNNNTVECGGTDGIYDTPYTKGSPTGVCFLTTNSCDDNDYPESINYWGTNVRDNIENFMDFSYCQGMFTNGQAEMMRYVAESPLYGRDSLWTEENLIATGTGPGVQPVSLATPYSDFNPVYSMNCTDDQLQMNISQGSTPGVSYFWSFPGGSPATSSLFEPNVLYSNPGFYDISLTTTNANGSSTTTQNAAVYVSGNWSEYTGPTLIDFENAPFWQSQNIEGDNGNFDQTPNSGVSNSGCFRLDNHYEIDSTALCTFNSPNQINGRKDNLVSPAFNLANTTSVTISYDVAYGSSATNNATEFMKVYASRDCGKTWNIKETVQANNLISTFAANNSNYVPAPNDWVHHTFNYTTTATDTKTRFKFEFVASNSSNNLYIDNFEINGILGISDDQASSILVFPNPATQGSAISISGLKAENADLFIFDMQGQKVFETELKSATTEETIQLNQALKSGCYVVQVSQASNQFRTRLIVE